VLLCSCVTSNSLVERGVFERYSSERTNLSKPSTLIWNRKRLSMTWKGGVKSCPPLSGIEILKLKGASSMTGAGLASSIDKSLNEESWLLIDIDIVSQLMLVCCCDETHDVLMQRTPSSSSLSLSSPSLSVSVVLCRDSFVGGRLTGRIPSCC